MQIEAMLHRVNEGASTRLHLQQKMVTHSSSVQTGILNGLEQLFAS